MKNTLQRVLSFIICFIVACCGNTLYANNNYRVRSSGKKIAAQFTTQNCVYVITNSIDLHQKTLTIPKGSILKFEGGEFMNGIVSGNATMVESPCCQIFSNNVSLTGTWKADRAYPEWFGAKADNERFDSREAMQKCIDNFSHVVLTGVYHFLTSTAEGGGVTLRIGSMIDGVSVPNPHSLMNGIVMKVPNADYVIKMENSTSISSIFVEGNSDGYSHKSKIKGLYTSGTSRMKVTNVQICKCYTAVDFTSYLSVLERVTAYYCERGFYCHGTDKSQYTSLVLTNCFANTCVDFGYKLDNIIYSSLISCAADYIGFNAAKDLKVSEKSESAYTFNKCLGIDVSACGSENSYKWISAVASNRLNIHSCRMTANYKDNANYRLDVKNCFDCNFDVSYEVKNAPSKYKIMKYSHYTNSCSNTVTSIKEEAIDYVSTGTELVDKIKRTLKLGRQ